VTGTVRKHLLPPLRPEGIQPQAAQLQQLIALAFAQLDCCAEALTATEPISR